MPQNTKGKKEASSKPEPEIQIQTQDTLIENFIASMDDKELLAYQIAKDHLESSFDIEKCIGFHSFKKQQD